MSIIPLTVPPKKLAQTISSTALTFKMNNIEGWNGVDLTPADFGTEAYGVFINSTRSQIEIFAFDPATIADPEITILRRGLGYSGQDVADPARQFPWASNDTTIQIGTDAPQLFRDFMSGSNTATITALHTYETLPQSAEVPTNDEDFTTKAYVDGLTEPAVTVPINQVAHGLSVGQVIRVSGANIYVPAQANSATGAEVVGIVTEVIDPDNFKYITEGVATSGVPAFPAGTVVFLSRTVAGALTDTDTTTIGEVSAPLGIITQNGAEMIFHRYRPAVINTISGNPIASETVAGTVEIATQAQVDNQDDVGETGAPLVVLPSRIPASAQVSVVGTLLDSVDATGGPVAVSYSEETGAIQKVTDAVGSPTFAGFLDNGLNNVLVQPSYLIGTGQFGQDVSGNSTTNIAIPAGDNVGLVVHTSTFGAGAANPSSMTFNGLPLTLVRAENITEQFNSVWFVALGNLPSGLTADLIISGNTGATMRLASAVAYADVAQITPTVSDIQFVNAASNSFVLTFPAGGGIVSQFPSCFSFSENVRTTTTGFVEISNDNLSYTAYNQIPTPDTTLTVTAVTDGPEFQSMSAVFLAPSGPSVPIKIKGIQGNFAGLTAGARYYADANGEPTLTGDGQFIGRALTATQLEINDVKDRNDGWELVTIAVCPSNQAVFDITDLHGYTELMILSKPPNFGRPDTSAASGFAYVSTDNGATFLSTNQYIASSSSLTDDNIFIVSNPGAQSAYIILHFMNWGTTAPIKVLANMGSTSGPFRYSIPTDLPLNAIRIQATGTHYVRSGAEFYVYGKRY